MDLQCAQALLFQYQICEIPSGLPSRSNISQTVCQENTPDHRLTCDGRGHS